MLKFFIPALLLGCLHKNVETVPTFDPSGSMCLDAFNMNIQNSQCSELDKKILNNEIISINCKKSYTDTFWTSRTFYIVVGEYDIEAEGVIPICVDHNIMIMTGNVAP